MLWRRDCSSMRDVEGSGCSAALGAAWDPWAGVWDLLMPPPTPEHSDRKSESILGFSAMDREKVEVSPAFPGLW